MKSLLNLLLFCILLYRVSSDSKTIVCDGFSVYPNVNATVGIERLRSHINHINQRNCTKIFGNIHVETVGTLFEGNRRVCAASNFKVHLPTVQEVTGYIYISDSCISEFRMDNLLQINAEDTYKKVHGEKGEYSLYIGDSFIHTLTFASLGDIANGSVYISMLIIDQRFQDICFQNTIDFTEILRDPTRQRAIVRNGGDDFCHRNNHLGKCHNSCRADHDNELHCWGPGPDQCQRFHKRPCQSAGLKCPNGLCYKNPAAPEGYTCCHDQCAVGCYGSQANQCFACLHVEDNGQCKETCYDGNQYVNGVLISVPSSKTYRLKTMCVKSCHTYGYLQEEAYCVRNCNASRKLMPNVDSTENGDGPWTRCISCPNDVCPKTCDAPASGTDQGIFESLNSIDSGCEILRGSVHLSGHTFKNMADGELHEKMSRFSTVKFITGNLIIQNWPLAEFNYFKELRLINVEASYRQPSVLQLVEFDNATSIEFPKLEQFNGRLTVALMPKLGQFLLPSLRKLRDSSIESKTNEMIIQKTPNLCYVHEVDWRSAFNMSLLRLDDGPAPTVFWRDLERNCTKQGNLCHPQCKYGCWGPRDTDCVQCANWEVFNGDDPRRGRCVLNCSPEENLFNKPDALRLCGRCHEQCKKGCNNEKQTECYECRNVRDNDRCVAACPLDKYNKSGTCMNCSRTCISPGQGRQHCYGPAPMWTREGGCATCHTVLAHRLATEDITYECMPERLCPENHFAGHFRDSDRIGRFFDKLPSPTLICRKCDPACDGCDEGGPNNCKRCSNGTFISGTDLTTCVMRNLCDLNKHVLENLTTIRSRVLSQNASKLNEDLHMLSGLPAETQFCTPCHEECGSFGCRGPSSSDCVNCLHFEVIGSDGRSFCNATCDGSAAFCSPVGSQVEGADANSLIKAIIVVLVIVVVIGVILAVFFWRRIGRPKHDFDSDESDTFDNFPVDQSGHLMLISEPQLIRGEVIGEGAFGTVYKGVWVFSVEGRQKIKVPVAIKELHEDAAPKHLGGELLKEAEVTAQVKHHNCVRMVGVCMPGNRIMLVTQLMPLGNLLKHIRDNCSRIQRRHMVMWCRQIADAMLHLESLNIVHRDLAARNVLVQTNTHVRICDFGLAKVLSHGTSQYNATGGKLPFKWLAPESLGCMSYRSSLQSTGGQLVDPQCLYVFTHKSDVWSFGVTIWEIVTFGAKPWEHELDPEKLKKHGMTSVEYLLELLVRHGERLRQPPAATPALYSLMLSCWQYEPEKRPDFQMIRNELSTPSDDHYINYTAFVNYRQQLEHQYNALTMPTRSFRTRRSCNDASQHGEPLSENHFNTLPSSGVDPNISVGQHHQKLLRELVDELTSDVDGEMKDVDEYWQMKASMCLSSGSRQTDSTSIENSNQTVIANHRLARTVSCRSRFGAPVSGNQDGNVSSNTLPVLAGGMASWHNGSGVVLTPGGAFTEAVSVAGPSRHHNYYNDNFMPYGLQVALPPEKGSGQKFVDPRARHYSPGVGGNGAGVSADARSATLPRLAVRRHLASDADEIGDAVAVNGTEVRCNPETASARYRAHHRPSRTPLIETVSGAVAAQQNGTFPPLTINGTPMNGSTVAVGTGGLARSAPDRKGSGRYTDDPCNISPGSKAASDCPSHLTNNGAGGDVDSVFEGSSVGTPSSADPQSGSSGLGSFSNHRKHSYINCTDDMKQLGSNGIFETSDLPLQPATRPGDEGYVEPDSANESMESGCTSERNRRADPPGLLQTGARLTASHEENQRVGPVQIERLSPSFAIKTPLDHRRRRPVAPVEPVSSAHMTGTNLFWPQPGHGYSNQEYLSQADPRLQSVSERDVSYSSQQPVVAFPGSPNSCSSTQRLLFAGSSSASTNPASFRDRSCSEDSTYSGVNFSDVQPFANRSSRAYSDTPSGIYVSPQETHV